MGCPKDPYSFSNIDRLIIYDTHVTNIEFYKRLLKYNYIKMNPLNACKTRFMTNTYNNYYDVMYFSIKSSRVMYQMMNSIFSK